MMKSYYYGLGEVVIGRICSVSIMALLTLINRVSLIKKSVRLTGTYYRNNALHGVDGGSNPSHCTNIWKMN